MKGSVCWSQYCRLECDLARDIIQKMRYKGVSLSWNWDKHCSKFHAQVRLIDEWAAVSNKDQISAFLNIIPKDCKNKLLIAKGIIEGDRSWFPTLVGNVIPHLTCPLKQKSTVLPLPSAQLPTRAPHLESVLTNVIKWGGLLARLRGSAVW